MIETKQLKLNVSNIKSTLIRGNKDLKKIRVQEKTLLLKQKKEQQKIQKEKFVEGKKSQSGKIGNAAKAAAAPAMGFFDKIKEFFSLLLVSFAINNAPQLIKGIEKFIEDNKWISKIFEVFFKSIEFIVPVFKNIIDFFNPSKRAEMEKNRSELTDSIDKLLGLNKDIEKDLKSVDAELDKAQKFQPKSDDEVRNDVAYAIKTKEISYIAMDNKLIAYDRAKQSNNQSDRVVIPGIGSYQKVKTGGLFGLGSTLVEKTTDVSGTEIPVDEFEKRVASIGRGRAPDGSDSAENYTSLQDLLKSLGVEGYSRGGTASSSPESPTAKKARIGLKSFSDAKSNANNQGMIIETQQKNNESFENLVKNFMELNKGDDDEDKPPQNPPGTPPGSPPTTTTGNPTGSNPAFGRIVGYVGSTGASTGPHIHIETGDGVSPYTDAGHAIPTEVLDNIMVDGKKLGSYTPNDVPRWRDHPVYGGRKYHYGYDYPIRPGAPIQLQGGLQFVDYDSTQDPRGFGNNIKIKDKNGNFYIIAHLSKGPDPVPPSGGPSRPAVQSLTPYQKSLYTGNKGGPMRHDMLTQTFDGEGMTDLIIINNTQPIVVPGPTRYIRR